MANPRDPTIDILIRRSFDFTNITARPLWSSSQQFCRTDGQKVDQHHCWSYGLKRLLSLAKTEPTVTRFFWVEFTRKRPSGPFIKIELIESAAAVAELLSLRLYFNGVSW